MSEVAASREEPARAQGLAAGSARDGDRAAPFGRSPGPTESGRGHVGSERKASDERGSFLQAPAYQLAWRHRWVGPDGAEREAMRAVDGVLAVDLAGQARRHARDAVGSEFRIALGSDAGARVATVHLVDIEAWVPVEGGLPKAGMKTFWADDDAATAARWSIYARISEALAEARERRLIGRRSSRSVLHRVRSLLIGGTP